MGMTIKRFVVPALVGVLGAGVAGCGTQDDGGRAGDDTGLTSALSGVPASAAEQPMTYRDVPTARRLLAADKTLYQGLDGYGVWELTGRPGSVASVKDSYGFEAGDVRTALQLGSGQAQRLTGTFDVSAARDAMEKDGYRASDSADDGVRLRKQGQATFDVSGTARVTKWLDDGPTLPLDPPDESVADDAAYQAVVGCLGDDVYEATLYGKRSEFRKQGVTLLGIGGRADGSASTEKLCALTTSKKSAEKIAGKLRTKTAPDERFAGSKVTIGDGDAPVVSMSWKNSTKSGLRPGDQDRTTELPKLLLWSWT
ncbi:hypothetical protein [Streptomyces sp. NPDC050264]|uniref:hypothetical protein n=1 Tax=Streptomyces sp. NPDC050264 TaxID=3155038 RepID=UPI003438E4EB